MKKLKGFSLAELLIALGIISIITTMGIQISKKGIERAYNYYYYTAYTGVLNVITDCNKKGYTFDSQNNITITVNYIKDKLASIEVLDEANSIKTAKSTAYQQATPLIFNNIYIAIRPAVDTVDVTNEKFVMILVSIPAPNNKRVYFELLYFPDLEGGLLLPAPHNWSGIESIQERPDLLPTYVDDGEVGRIKKIYDPETATYYISSNGYRKPYLQSYEATYCQLYAKSLMNIISCGNSSPNKIGTLKIANPKKFF